MAGMDWLESSSFSSQEFGRFKFKNLIAFLDKATQKNKSRPQRFKNYL